VSILEGVYWDLDGTIANTELEAHLPAFNSAFKDYGLIWNWDISTYVNLLKINGGKNRIIYFSKICNKLISNELATKIHKRKQFHYLENVKNNSVKLKTGVKRLINELTQKNVRQFIVTSSSKIQVELLVRYLFDNLNPFEFIISSDDVEDHKPNPLPYLEAIRLSGIKNTKSIVFEDSNPGIKASIAANLPTIYIPSNIPTNLDEDIKLDCIINSLGDGIEVAKVVKGPKIDSKYVDYSYLNKYLKLIFNAEN